MLKVRLEHLAQLDSLEALDLVVKVDKEVKTYILHIFIFYCL